MLVARSVGISFMYLDTMRDMCGNHTRQLIVMRLSELFSPPDGGMGLGEARSSLEESLELSKT